MYRISFLKHWQSPLYFRPCLRMIKIMWTTKQKNLLSFSFSFPFLSDAHKVTLLSLVFVCWLVICRDQQLFDKQNCDRKILKIFFSFVTIWLFGLAYILWKSAPVLISSIGVRRCWFQYTNFCWQTELNHTLDL